MTDISTVICKLKHKTSKLLSIDQRNGQADFKGQTQSALDSCSVYIIGPVDLYF